LLLEPFRRRGTDPTESLAAFVGRRFGPEAVSLAEALASGVFGGDAHSIEMAAAFPAISRMESEHGGLIRAMWARRKRPRTRRPALISFEDGMAALAGELARSLGADILFGHDVIGIERIADRWRVRLAGDRPPVEAGELVLAVPAAIAAGLVRSEDPELASSLSEIQVGSIANVYLGFEGSDVQERLRGFGFLMTRGEASPILGAMYCSSVFPQSATEGRFLVRVMAGGVLHPHVVDWDDDTLVAEALATLRRYTGLNTRPQFQKVIRARNAIPQYVTGHSKRIEAIRACVQRHPDLSLIGNSYDEISVPGQLRRARNPVAT
jgi:oxygen-dependent protoporphyrinogen oxidase